MMSQVRELRLTNMAPKGDIDDEDVTESDDDRPPALQNLTKEMRFKGIVKQLQN